MRVLGGRIKHGLEVEGSIKNLEMPFAIQPAALIKFDIQRHASNMLLTSSTWKSLSARSRSKKAGSSPVSAKNVQEVSEPWLNPQPVLRFAVSASEKAFFNYGTVPTFSGAKCSESWSGARFRLWWRVNFIW